MNYIEFTIQQKLPSQLMTLIHGCVEYFSDYDICRGTWNISSDFNAFSHPYICNEFLHSITTHE